MSRFNTKANPTAKRSPMVSKGQTRTHEGGVGSVKDSQTELYMTAVSFMGGDANFYETSDQRYERLIGLAGKVACEDGEWFKDFVRWVRTGANMRTAAGVMAVEGVRARVEMMQRNGDDTKQGTLNREIIDAACSRADEPGELLAYYLGRYGKSIPWPIRNGVGDAATRLYTERGYLRYGAGHTKSVSFADVIRLTHPKPQDDKQSNLFSYICTPGSWAGDLSLHNIDARNRLNAIPMDKRAEAFKAPHDTHLRDAEMDHMTLSAWLGEMNKEAWEAVIPQMGVMAMLMNLRNFDKVGISDEAREVVISKITDPEAVRDSRVLPMRFFSAFRNAPSVSWHWPLEQGINHSLSNIPKIDGSTLVMIDMSDSMNWGRISDRSELTYADAAKIFGSVLKARNPHFDLVQYGTNYSPINVPPGTSVLKIMQKFRDMGGTLTNQVLRHLYKPGAYKRVIIVTDEQAHSHVGSDVGDFLPKDVMLYTWNLAGYAPSHTDQGFGNKHYLGGGFSDASFNTIQLIEQRGKGMWPWQVEGAPSSGG